MDIESVVLFDVLFYSLVVVGLFEATFLLLLKAFFCQEGLNRIPSVVAGILTAVWGVGFMCHLKEHYPEIWPYILAGVIFMTLMIGILLFRLFKKA